MPDEATMVSDDDFIAEGDRACRWLSERPVVQGDAPDQTSYALYRRYLHDVQTPDGWPFSDEPGGVRSSVIYDAWDFLCPNLQERHIWTPPPDYESND